MPDTSGGSIQRRYIHSDIYDRLIQNDENDLVGLVAYGLYQRQKRRWIDSFERDRGRTPSEDEVKEYCYIFDDDVLKDLRARAENLLSRIAFNYAQTNPLKEEILGSLVTGELTQIRESFSSALIAVDRKLTDLSSVGHHVKGHWIGFGSLVAAAIFIFAVVNYEPTLHGVLHFFGLGQQSTPTH